MLFESKVRGIKLLDFLIWAHQSFNRDDDQKIDNGVLALPAIQRDSAWNPKQVLDLWDTVFRGLPLGAFMLQQRPNGQQGHRAGADARNKVQPEGWDLLDGQQRLRSLLLGRYGFNLAQGARDARCIWIKFDDGKGDPSFKLFLTSASQPFGYDDSGYKLGTTERGTARGRYEPKHKRILCCGRRAYTHELFQKFIERDDMSLADDSAIQPMPMPMPPDGHPERWPPLPFKSERNTVEGKAIFSILPLHVLLQTWFDALPTERKAKMEKLVGATNSPRVVEMVRHLDEAEVALIDATLANNVENLRRLYDRIGAGGTPLSNEDRLFSLYKSLSPHFHNLVLEIRQKVGSVMPPTKIATTAIRIANARSHQLRGEPSDKGNNIPDIVAFSSAVGEDGHSLIKMLNDICPEENGIFADIFINTSNAIKYSDNNQLGFPASIMRYLPSHLIHTLVFWKMQPDQISIQIAITPSHSA